MGKQPIKHIKIVKKPTKKPTKKPSRKLKKKAGKKRKRDSGKEVDTQPVQRFGDMPHVDDISDGASGSRHKYESSSSGIFESLNDVYNSYGHTSDSGSTDDSRSTKYTSRNSAGSYSHGEQSSNEQSSNEESSNEESSNEESTDEQSSNEMENILYKTDDMIGDKRTSWEEKMILFFWDY